MNISSKEDIRTNRNIYHHAGVIITKFLNAGLLTCVMNFLDLKEGNLVELLLQFGLEEKIETIRKDIDLFDRYILIED